MRNLQVLGGAAQVAVFDGHRRRALFLPAHEIFIHFLAAYRLLTRLERLSRLRHDTSRAADHVC